MRAPSTPLSPDVGAALPEYGAPMLVRLVHASAEQPDGRASVVMAVHDHVRRGEWIVFRLRVPGDGPLGGPLMRDAFRVKAADVVAIEVVALLDDAGGTTAG